MRFKIVWKIVTTFFGLNGEDTSWHKSWLNSKINQTIHINMRHKKALKWQGSGTFISLQIIQMYLTNS